MRIIACGVLATLGLLAAPQEAWATSIFLVVGIGGPVGGLIRLWG